MKSINLDDSSLLDICRDNVFKAVFTKDILRNKPAKGVIIGRVIMRILTALGLFIGLCFFSGCEQIIEGQPPLDITWRESRLDKAGGGFAVVKGQPAQLSYVLQIKNTGTAEINKIQVSVKSLTGETEEYEIPRIKPDKVEELGKLETKGRGFFNGDEITVFVPNYTQRKAITLQKTAAAAIDEEPPLDISWRRARLDAGFSYVLQIAVSPAAETAVPEVEVSVVSEKGETEVHHITLGSDARKELGRAETKGRGFHKNDVITLTVPGYAKSKTVTVQKIIE